MIFLFCLSCITSSPVHEQDSFAPTLVGIVQKLTWTYNSDCTGIQARWFTTLPRETNVQVMIGPKTQNPHFDDDALVTIDTTVDTVGEISVQADDIHLPVQTTFINLRVWGKKSHVHEMLIQSQEKGGFPVAQSPNGPYAWAETTITPCKK